MPATGTPPEEGFEPHFTFSVQPLSTAAFDHCRNLGAGLQVFKLSTVNYG
jgi:hypothetical protein